MTRSPVLVLCAVGSMMLGAVLERVAAQPTTAPAATQPAGAARAAIQFEGGHDTIDADRGRPVMLIAAALRVPTEVFREAFTQVHPAQGGRGPTQDEARANKAVLFGALAKYGVTNDRLDEVSNYYRYRRENGELWTHRDASAFATIDADGKIASITVTDGGAGYSTPPKLSVPGHPQATLVPTLGFGTDLKTNGRIESIKLADGPASRPATDAPSGTSSGET